MLSNAPLQENINPSLHPSQSSRFTIGQWIYCLTLHVNLTIASTTRGFQALFRNFLFIYLSYFNKKIKNIFFFSFSRWAWLLPVNHQRATTTRSAVLHSPITPLVPVALPLLPPSDSPSTLPLNYHNNTRPVATTLQTLQASEKEKKKIFFIFLLKYDK